MRWRRAAKILLVIVVVLAVAFLSLVYTDTGQQFLLRRAENFAAAAGFPFQAQRLQLRPADLTLSLTDLVYDQKGVRVRIARLAIDFPWKFYTSAGITISSVEADGVEVRIISPEPFLPEPSGQTNRLSRLRIGRFNLRDGSFTYENQSTRVDIPAFAMETAGNEGRILLQAPITANKDTEVRVNEIPVTVSSEGLRFGLVDWSASHGQRSGSGDVSGAVRWVPSISATMDLTTDPFAFENWTGIVARGRIVYEDGVLNVRNFVATRGRGQVTGTAKISDADKSAALRWNDIRLEPAGLAGATNGQLDLSWHASDFSDLSGNGRVAIDTRDYGKAQGSVRLSKGRVELNLRAASMGATIQARVLTGLNRRLAGNFSLTHRQYGDVSAKGTLAGTWTSPAATASIKANDVTYKGVGPLDADAQASYRDKILTLTDIDARLKNSTAPNGNLRVDLKTRMIDGALPEIHAQLHDFVEDGTGAIQGAAQISGSLDQPLATFTASSSGLDIGGTHIDSVAADARLENDILQVTRLVATQEKGVAEATGEANLQTERISGNVNVSNLQITQVRGLSGTVNLNATVAGTYRAPSANGTGEISNVIYQGQEHGTVQFNASAEGKTLNAQLQSSKYNATVDGVVELDASYPFSATVVTKQSPIHYEQYDVVATGTLLAGGSLRPVSVISLETQDFKLTGEGIDLTANGSLDTGISAVLVADLAQLPIEKTVQPVEKTFQLGGQAEVSAVVRGPLENPSVDGTLRTINATVRTMDLPEPATVAADVDFTRDTFVIRNMRADYADAHFVINGNGTLKGTGDFTFTAENIRPERFFTERSLFGVIGLKGEMSVTAPRLDAIDGRATVTELDLVAGGVEFRQTQQGEVVVANKIASVRNFELSGPETDAFISGTVNLETGALNLDARANTDLRILEGFISRSNALGEINSEVAIRGTFRQPDMSGFVNLREAQIELSEPPLLLSQLNARLRLEGDGFQVESGTGDLNGGSFNLSGTSSVASGGLRNANLRASLKGAQLEYPEGLQSEIAANLALTGSTPNLVLTGNVDVLDALYRRDINVQEEVFEQLTSQGENGFNLEEPGFTEQVNIDVTVETTGPVAISNNVAKIDLTGGFRVRGTIAEPIVLGRAEALEGGEIYFGPSVGGEAAALGERRDRYIVERGTVDFNNPLRTEPTIDFEATHELQARNERYLVRLKATGTPTDLRTELSSDPFLSEPDIIAMLLTGRSFADLQSAQLSVARDQLFNYLSGQLSSQFFQGAGMALGLNTVTIEPVTLAAEEEISARLTVGKDLTNDLSLIYSQNLSGPRDQAWILNYSTFRNFVLRGINRTDRDELRFELRHGLEFGGGPALPRRIAPRDESRLTAVTFSGTTFSREQLLRRVGKIGDPYNSYRMQDNVRSLREFFSSEGFPEARVRAERNVVNGMADVSFTINQGPKVRFEFRGAEVSKDVQKQIVDAWETGFAEGPSLRESIELLLRHFRDEGYLQVDVKGANESQNLDERLFVFQIEPGMRFKKPVWRFEGVESVDVTDSAGEILRDPEGIKEQIERKLKGQGFLDAKSTVPSLVIGAAGAVPYFSVTVTPGVQYMVSGLSYSGNSFFQNPHLTRVVLLGPTEVIPADQTGGARPPDTEEPLKPFPYTSDWTSIARRRLLTEYWQQGFNEVQIGASTDYTPGSGRIEVQFLVTEGKRQEISEIDIQGDNKTVRSHLRRYFQFQTGDPVDYTRLNLTRKKLYDTGLFKRVEIDVTNDGGRYIANVNLNERAPWDVRYGLTATDHQDQNSRDFGVTTELTHRNIYGKGITAGTRLRADATLRDARVFTSFPVFMNRDVTSTATLFRTRETLPDSITNSWGFTLQQQWRLTDFYLLSYDYTYRRVATAERDLTEDDPEILNGVIPIARFNATLSRDTRDDLLNATRGTFFSNSFQLAPPGIGSAVKFVRNYTQYLRFREVRPNLIWASAYRLGMARAFGGGTLTETDQFRAVASLRAFGQDSDALKPGNALFVTNQELRRPLFWRFGVVGFFDVGNVYERIGRAKPFQQRYSPGFGLRINTPFILLRVDMGFNLWPRTGEDRQTISWGIGQAF